MRQTVLVIHPGAIGDVLLALPAIRALRAGFPNHEHVLLAGGRIGALLQVCQEIDHAIALEGSTLTTLMAGVERVPSSQRRWLGGCELVVCWMRDSDKEMAATFRRLGVPKVVVQSPWETGHHDRHQIDRFLATVRFLVPEGSYDRPLTLPPSVREAGAARLNELLQGKADDIVVVHPGSGSRHKCSEPTLLAGLIGTLQGRSSTSIVLIGPADDEISGQLLASCPVVPPVLKHLDLLSVASVLANTTLYVGHDSGLTHLAAALGRTTLALFGPTEAGRWAPRGSHVLILTGGPCGCKGWSAVQTCQAKPCLRIDLGRLVAACEARSQFNPAGVSRFGRP